MEETNKLAPIVLFCYNRPWHTQQTLDALAKNELATDSDLYIFCDGPKKDATSEVLNSISETRTIAKNENRFGKVTVIEAPSNKGLAASIIDGVTEIVNKYGKIIVLEDDIVTSPGFLNYMNEALELYQKDDKVMHISGYMYPVKNKLPETFFIRPTSCWGWATWKRAWNYFEKDVDKQIEEINKINGWEEFSLKNACPSFRDQLFLNQSGELNTWAIFWQTSVFLKRGLALHPSISYTQNIGLDGSGTNCDSSNNYNITDLNDFSELKKNRVRINKTVTKKLEFYFNSITKSRKVGIRDKIYLLRKKIFKK